MTGTPTSAVRDFRVFFTSEGTSTPDMEGMSRHDLQRATCTVLATAFAQVLTVQEMIEKLGAARA